MTSLKVKDRFTIRTEYLEETSHSFCNEHTLCCFSICWFSLYIKWFLKLYPLLWSNNHSSSSSNAFIYSYIDSTSPISLKDSKSSESNREWRLSPVNTLVSPTAPFFFWIIRKGLNPKRLCLCCLHHCQCLLYQHCEVVCNQLVLHLLDIMKYEVHYVSN